jgi:hypothetical protein
MEGQKMNANYLSKSIARIAAAGVTALLASSAYANVVNIDFDSLSVAPGSSISGAPVTNYLASYGITLSGMLAGESEYVLNASNINWVSSHSGPNVFFVGGINPIDTFTLNFSTAVDNFSFDRIGNVAAYSPSGTTKGPWSAVAYDAANNVLGSIGEGYIGTYGDVPTQTFTLANTGIDHIAFTGNSFNFAGTNLPMMDNFSFTAEVPEPGTCALFLAGLVALGFIGRRRNEKCQEKNLA